MDFFLYYCSMLNFYAVEVSQHAIPVIHRILPDLFSIVKMVEVVRTDLLEIFKKAKEKCRISMHQIIQKTKDGEEPDSEAASNCEEII